MVHAIVSKPGSMQVEQRFLFFFLYVL